MQLRQASKDLRKILSSAENNVLVEEGFVYYAGLLTSNLAAYEADLFNKANGLTKSLMGLVEWLDNVRDGFQKIEITQKQMVADWRTRLDRLKELQEEEQSKTE